MEVELLMHIDDVLDIPAMEGLKQGVLEAEGVTTADFCPDKNHLLLIKYNPRITTSAALLHRVRESGVIAQTVGL